MFGAKHFKRLTASHQGCWMLAGRSLQHFLKWPLVRWSIAHQYSTLLERFYLQCCHCSSNLSTFWKRSFVISVLQHISSTSLQNNLLKRFDVKPPWTPTRYLLLRHKKLFIHPHAWSFTWKRRSKRNKMRKVMQEGRKKGKKNKTEKWREKMSSCRKTTFKRKLKTNKKKKSWEENKEIRCRCDGCKTKSGRDEAKTGQY